MTILIKWDDLNADNFYVINNYSPFKLYVGDDKFEGICKIDASAVTNKKILLKINKLNDNIIDIPEVENFDEFRQNIWFLFK
jgi:hypothetical protein